MTITWEAPAEADKPQPKVRPNHDRTTIDLLVNHLKAADDRRARTQQKVPGPSSVYKCQQAAIKRLLGHHPTNPNVKRLPSIMGTAIHRAAEDALEGVPGLATEVEFPGIPGVIGPAHVDVSFFGRQRIVDWKTTKKARLSDFPTKPQIGQVQIYGYLATRAGHTVKEVELVAIPRDGTEDDIVNHVEPYDEAKALEALEWFHEVAAHVKAGTMPECTCIPNVCKHYCLWYEEDE